MFTLSIEGNINAEGAYQARTQAEVDMSPEGIIFPSIGKTFNLILDLLHIHIKLINNHMRVQL